MSDIHIFKNVSCYFSNSLVLNGTCKHFNITGNAGVSRKMLNVRDQMVQPWAHLWEIMVEANGKANFELCEARFVDNN